MPPGFMMPLPPLGERGLMGGMEPGLIQTIPGGFDPQQHQQDFQQQQNMMMAQFQAMHPMQHQAGGSGTRPGASMGGPNPWEQQHLGQVVVGHRPGPVAVGLQGEGGSPQAQTSQREQSQQHNQQQSSQQQHDQRDQQSGSRQDRDGAGSRGARRNDNRIEERLKMEEVEKLKCHLHKRPKAGCKFCGKHQAKLEELKGPSPGDRDRGQGNAVGSRSGAPRRLDRAISEERDSREGKLEIANVKNYGFSGLLQTHVVECAHFKSLLSLETFEQLVDETYQFANNVEPYMTNSGTLPSALFCCLYRFLTLGIDARQLKRLMDHQESPYIRCCGFLFVRFGLPHDQLSAWLSEYLLDDEEFKPSPDSEWRTTIGEYVEGLMSQDKYYNTVLPRLPMATKRRIEEKLAPVGQNRKRTKANKDNLNAFREPGMKVEVNIGGDWLYGTLLELEEDIPTRVKVRVRVDDGSEEYVHLGKTIMLERQTRRRSRSRRGGGGRSRSRSKTDWSRTRGRSDAELLDEMRSRDREKAVCSSGKDYARKPIGYKQACALPREQGSASYKLMEEETFVPMSRSKRTRSPSIERDSVGNARRPSAEHQARMQQLFEKYSTTSKSASEGGGRSASDEVDRPDVMRLG
eukprot:TRINITY_DN8578_c0_g2_i1.p1 TRINITY_DN8578_c0_g2~~TRINITY_DN8578_c0_g2_i1.p1  ORF type:complete len:695 (+),score=150.53 TRINITY_DN8578_c0_g2_i1:190-2085(+)